MQQVKQVEIKLNGINQVIIFTITANGQVEASNSDDVKIRCRVLLPANKDNELIEELRFGQRCTFFDEQLYKFWHARVEKDGKSYRSHTFPMSGKTWKETEILAKKKFHVEVDKIQAVLKTRQLALSNAGNFQDDISFSYA